MRYSTDHKQETRAKLLKEAAREIRSKGPNGIAVGGIMGRLGLTHGGFYAHFKSKDQLVAEAIGTMFDEAQARFDRGGVTATPAKALNDYIAFYLSTAHRDSTERGCPLAALGSEAPRLTARSRAHFAAGLEGLTGRLARALDGHGISDPATAASSMVAELVGALSMARAVEDRAQSDAILERSARAIRARFGLGE